MFDLDRWQEIIRTIKRHKLRTLLTAFGVFWGIFMLILLMGVGSGFENGSLQNLSGYAINSFIIWPTQTSLPYKGLPIGRKIQFTNDDYNKINNTVKDIQYISPRSRFSNSCNVTKGSLIGSFLINGDYPQYKYIKSLKLTRGRFINENDILLKRKIAIIGNRVKEILFPNESPVGKLINVKGIFFKVVGVIGINEGNSMSNKDDQEIIYIPHSSFQQCFNSQNLIDHFVISVNDGAQAMPVIENVRSMIAKNHTVSPNDKRVLEYWSAEETYLKFKNLFTNIRLFVWFVGAGSLLAGIIGVSNIMLISVKERTKEIGIRKALGATPSSIIILIIQESTLITTISGSAGLLVGVSFIKVINYAMIKFHIKNDFFLDPQVKYDLVLISLFLLIASGVLAGFFPARNAANINPIESLRYE